MRRIHRVASVLLMASCLGLFLSSHIPAEERGGIEEGIRKAMDLKRANFGDDDIRETLLTVPRLPVRRILLRSRWSGSGKSLARSP